MGHLLLAAATHKHATSNEPAVACVPTQILLNMQSQCLQAAADKFNIDVSGCSVLDFLDTSNPLVEK